MHNIKDIRQNPNFYKDKLMERNYNLDLDGLIEFDKKNRELITNKESLEQEKKKQKRGGDIHQRFAARRESAVEQVDIDMLTAGQKIATADNSVDAK